MNDTKMQNALDLRILLGITGGIAAYKCPELIRQLKAEGVEVQVVCTKSALHFVTETTLHAVSGHPVYSDLWNAQTQNAMQHIELARNADLILIAPASANFLAHLAHGFADDLLTNLCLAAPGPIIVAPAMNEKMWLNPATQKNVCILKEHGVHVLPVAIGEQACGDSGPGRMLEPTEILSHLKEQFIPKHSLYLRGKKVLITAGPTQEALDPVRYLSNRSSGKMGYALAEAAIRAGATVHVISGPVHIKRHPSIHYVDVTTATQMFEAVNHALTDTTIFIATAAVCDYRSETITTKKITKSTHAHDYSLKLIPNVDILNHVAHLSNRPFCVGFAAQTHDVLHYGRQKLAEKNLDMIVVNDVSQADVGFDSDYNECTVLWDQHQQFFPRIEKLILADQLLKLIAEVFHERHVSP